MERYLICENPLCRFVVDLRTEENRIVPVSDLIISQCPECEGKWSSHCPFCSEPLDVTWRAAVPLCSLCFVELKARPLGNKNQ